MRKIIKKSIAVATVGAMALGMTACGSDATSNSTSTDTTSAKLDKEYIDMFKKAGKATDTEGSVIQNIVSLQGNSIEYLDVKTTDGSYTEYYVSDASTLTDEERSVLQDTKGTISDADASTDEDSSEKTDSKDSKDTATDTTDDADSTTDTSIEEGFVLSDWLTYKDGKADKFYTLNSSYAGEDSKDTGKEWYEFGNDMKDLASQRTSMYVDLLADGISDVEDQGTQKGTTESTGDVSVHVFTAKIKGDVVTKMLALQGSMQYQDALSTLKSSGKKVDSTVLDQIENYNDYYNSLWTVGDGDISWGIIDDKDGKLAFLDISTGGAGTTLSITKELVMEGVDLRDKPDFTSSEPYSDFIVNAIQESFKEEHEAHTNAEAADESATGETVDGNTVTDESTTDGTDVTDATVSDDVTSKDTQGTAENATEESNNTGTDAEAGTETAETETNASKETTKSDDTSKEDKSVEATPAADATKDANTSK